MRKEILSELLKQAYQPENIDHLALNEFLQKTSGNPEICFADFERFLNMYQSQNLLALTPIEKKLLLSTGGNDEQLFLFYILRKQIKDTALSEFQTTQPLEMPILPLNPYSGYSMEYQPFSSTIDSQPAAKKNKIIPGQVCTGDKARRYCYYGHPEELLPNGLPILEEGTYGKGKKLFVTLKTPQGDEKEVRIQRADRAKKSKNINKTQKETNPQPPKVQNLERFTGLGTNSFCLHSEAVKHGIIAPVNAGLRIIEEGTRGNGKQLYVMIDGKKERIILAYNTKRLIKKNGQQPLTLHTRPTADFFAPPVFPTESALETKTEPLLSSWEQMTTLSFEDLSELRSNPDNIGSREEDEFPSFLLGERDEPPSFLLEEGGEFSGDEDGPSEFPPLFKDNDSEDDEPRASTHGFFSPQPCSLAISQAPEKTRSQNPSR